MQLKLPGIILRIKFNQIEKKKHKRFFISLCRQIYQISKNHRKFFILKKPRVEAMSNICLPGGWLEPEESFVWWKILEGFFLEITPEGLVQCLTIYPFVMLLILTCMCVCLFFYQLFHCYTANFGPIIQVQSHSIDAITGSLVTMLSLAKHLVGFY